MKILVVTHGYEPVYSACAARWTAVTREMVRAGNSVTVVTAWHPGLARREILAGVQILRTGGLLSSGLRAKAKARWGLGSSSTNGLRPGGSLARRTLLALYTKLWRRLYWPDSSALWVGSAVAATCSELEAGYDVVFSVAMPFSGHLVTLVALAISKVSTPWIADYGDPFSYLKDTPPNNSALFGWLNRRVDNAVITTAERVTFPNRELGELYETGLSTPFQWSVVTHLAAGAPEPDRPSSQSQGTISLCYAGTFAAGVRRPDYMFSVLPHLIRAMKNRGYAVRFDLYGALNDCAPSLDAVRDEVEAGAIVIHGSVPPREARAAVGAASCLVTVGNSTWFRQPSKIAEYMSTGKPIVCFATGPTDSSLSMLKGYSAACVVCEGTDDSVSAAEAITSFLLSARSVPEGERMAIRNRHSAHAIAADYLQVADTVLVGRASA